MEPDLIEPGGDPDINGIDTATIAFVEMRDSFSTLARAVRSLSGEWKALVIPTKARRSIKLRKSARDRTDFRFGRNGFRGRKCKS